MENFSIQQIKEGLRQCLIIQNCEKCPYYNNGNNCVDLLYKDIDLILQRFSILTDDNE